MFESIILIRICGEICTPTASSNDIYLNPHGDCKKIRVDFLELVNYSVHPFSNNNLKASTAFREMNLKIQPLHIFKDNLHL